MKKALTIIIALAVIAPSACKKEEKAEPAKAEIKKYAKFRAAVYKEPELKSWLATLEKAEDVSIIAEENVADSKGKISTVAKVKLADDSQGYINPSYLAEAPVVFVQETKAFVRPTIGSTIRATIPAAELGFITSEKDGWAKVYVGELPGGKKVYSDWVNGGYSTDPKLILEAKQYHNAVEKAGKDSTRAAALETLKTLSEGSSVIAVIAKDKLAEIEADNEKGEESSDFSGEDPSDNKSENKQEEAAE